MTTSRAGIVFDLDGTLVESAPDLMSALNAALVDAGRETVSLAAVKGMIGDGLPVLVERGFAATGGVPGEVELARAGAHCLAHYEAHPTDESFVFPGVSGALEVLHKAGYVLGVCTNKPHKAAVSVLQNFGLSDYFEAIVGGDSFAFRKPDPRLLLETLSGMSVDVERSVLVGDSRNDALAASGAGVPFVLVSFGYANDSIDNLAPIAVLDAFDDLPALIETLDL